MSARRYALATSVFAITWALCVTAHAQQSNPPPSPDGGKPAQAQQTPAQPSALQSSQQDQTAAAAQSQVQQPASGLSKQVQPKVVYPAPNEIADSTLDMVEQLNLSPEQIDRLKAMKIERERSKATPYVVPPKPVTRTLPVSLDPGVSPPVLRLTKGQQSSIVFSDNTGQPWMVENVSVNCAFFKIDACAQDDKGKAAAKPTNILTIEAANEAAYGNVTVTLRGLSTPVIFVLTSAQQEVDMRVDAKIPGHNPDGQESVSFNAMPTIDTALTSFLDDVPPKGAQNLTVSGLDGVEAWMFDDCLYVRVRGDAQYPAFLSTARSTSGVSVYRYAEKHSSATFLIGGQAVTVFIQ